MKECPKCKGCYEDYLNLCPLDGRSLEAGLPGPTILAERFRVEALLGKGGMGAVYRAMHLGLKRHIALKTLLPDRKSGAEFLERFKCEAEAAGRIKHANVVDVMDFGFAEVGGQFIAYLAMELLDGYTLRKLLQKKGSLPLTTTVEIIEQVCEATEAAHQLGIIHRDLKPENIVLAEQGANRYRVKVLDFGIAKIAHQQSTGITAELPPIAPPAHDAIVDAQENSQESAIAVQDPFATAQTKSKSLFRTPADKLTEIGFVMGTLPYMSPEQCRGEPCTPAVDIYSLGIIAYEMLTGEMPFKGDGKELAVQHLSEIPRPPSQFKPQLPVSVDAAVMRALAKSPAERPASARQFAQALGAHLSERRRNRAIVRKIAIATAIAVIVFGVSATVNNWHWVRDRWQGIKQTMGWTRAPVKMVSYAQLKLISLTDGKETVLASSPPVKASQIDSEQFIARFSPDSHLLAICAKRPPEGQRQIIELWQMQHHEKRREIVVEDLDPLHDLQFSPDGKALLAASLNEIRLFSIDDGRQIDTVTTLENNDYCRLAAGGELLLVASVRRPAVKTGVTLSYPLKKMNSLVSLWRRKDGKKLADIAHAYGEIEAVAVSADGQRALLQWRVQERRPARRIELWELSSSGAQRQKSWPVDGSGGLAIAPRADKAALQLSPTTIVEVELLSSAVLTTHTVKSPPRRLHYRRDGSLIAVTTAEIINLTDDSLIRTLSARESVLELTADGDSLVLEDVVTQER